MQYPKIMQPTHARWEQVSPSSPRSETLEITHGDTPNGIIADSDGHDKASDTIFPDILPVFKRNFMISDTYYTTPTSSTLGYPGPDEEVLDVGPGGLTQVPEDVLVELPDSCRQSFNEARAAERKWKRSWGTENDDRARAKLRITYNV